MTEVQYAEQPVGVPNQSIWAMVEYGSAKPEAKYYTADELLIFADRTHELRVGAGGVQALSAGPGVPHEPTNEMYRAAQKIELPYGDEDGTFILNTSQVRAIWHAMLAASPTPPAEQPADELRHQLKLLADALAACCLLYTSPSPRDA